MGQHCIGTAQTSLLASSRSYQVGSPVGQDGKPLLISSTCWGPGWGPGREVSTGDKKAGVLSFSQELVLTSRIPAGEGSLGWSQGAPCGAMTLSACPAPVEADGHQPQRLLPVRLTGPPTMLSCPARPSFPCLFTPQSAHCLTFRASFLVSTSLPSERGVMRKGLQLPSPCLPGCPGHLAVCGLSGVWQPAAGPPSSVRQGAGIAALGCGPREVLECEECSVCTSGLPQHL